MDEYSVSKAMGKYVVVSPLTKSSVLKAEEVATVFTVDSIGTYCDLSQCDITVGDLIIVAPGSIEKTRAEDKEIYFVRDTDVIARVIKQVR